MKNITNNVFSKYKSKAKKILSTYKYAHYARIQSMEEEYQNNNHPIKLKHILNLIASQKGFIDWQNFKEKNSQALISIFKIYLNWENIHQTIRLDEKIYNLCTSLSQVYDLSRINLDNIQFDNFNFNSDINTEDSHHPFGGFLSCLKISNSSLKNCSFVNCQPAFSIFENVNLEDSNFSGIPLSFHKNIIKYDGFHVNPDFDSSKFINCNLKKVILCKSYGRKSYFLNCDLSEAIFYNSNFYESEFIECNLKRADMRYAAFGKIKNSNLRGVNLLGSSNHTLYNVIIDHETIFSDGTKLYLTKHNLNKSDNGISTNSSKNMWWHCPKGHIWIKSVLEFSKRPYCLTCHSSNINIL